jgi:hypothetical protein
MKYLALLATLAISMGSVACKKSAAAASTVPVVITIFPTATQTVLPGGTLTFTETVTNTTNTAVTWEVNGAAGGSLTTGTISTTGVYTAPSSNNVINPFDVTVSVVSAADSTKIASTTVSIVLPPPVAVSPASATLAAGATQQFTVTTVPANLAITWAVNNQVGGSSTAGTITQAGLYTAPQVPPAAGTVSVSATLQANTAEFSVATVVLTYSNFSLQSSYVFSLRGSDSSGLLLRAGRFTADGNGNITAGVEDINNGVTLVQSAVSFTGTYAIGGDGRGSITFNDGFNGNTGGAGSGSKFSAVIVSAQQVPMIELDTFASANGEADLQSTSTFGAALFHGEYTFDFSGADAATKPLSAVGLFLADGVGGGASQPAQDDVNDNGTLTSSTPTFSFQSVAANGRGLATLNGASYSFYMVSPASAEFIAIGNPSGSVTAGLATLQSASTFSSNSLGGNSLLITNGSSTAGPVSAAASFFAAGNSNGTTGTFGAGGSGVLNENNAGNVSSANFSGTYTVAPNGRGTAVLSPGGQQYVFYLSGVNQGVVQETDNGIVSDGTLVGLSGGSFNTSNLANGYAMQLTGITAGQGEQDVLGQLNTAGGLVATGTVDVDTANGASGLTAFTPKPGVAIPSGTTYSILNSQGPLNITVNGTNLQFLAYFLSSSSLYLLRTDMTDPRVLHGNLLQDVSLSPAIVSANTVSFSVNVQGTFTVIATGNPAPTLSESGALPSGVTFDAQSGVLSGTPATGTGGTVNQSYPIQFTATNSVGSTAVQNFNLIVVDCVLEGNGTCATN